MKKGISIFLCLLLLLIMLVGCGGAPEESKYKAIDYAEALKQAGFPISSISDYTDKTDPNGLLGRPGEYTSKVNWADTRVEQYDVDEDPLGGTIEVFSSKNDMESRKQYLEMMAVNEYIYESPDGLALMRIDYDIVPDDAKQYENAFYEFCEKGSMSSVQIDVPEPSPSTEDSALEDDILDNNGGQNDATVYNQKLLSYYGAMKELTSSLEPLIDNFENMCELAEKADIGLGTYAAENESAMEFIKLLGTVKENVENIYDSAELSGAPSECSYAQGIASDINIYFVEILTLMEEAYSETTADAITAYSDLTKEYYGVVSDSMDLLKAYLESEGLNVEA